MVLLTYNFVQLRKEVSKMAVIRFIADYDLVVPKDSESISINIPGDESGKKKTLSILGLSKKNDMVKEEGTDQIILCDKDGNFYEASVHEFREIIKILQIRSGDEPDRYRSGKAFVHNMRGK